MSLWPQSLWPRTKTILAAGLAGLVLAGAASVATRTG